MFLEEKTVACWKGGIRYFHFREENENVEDENVKILTLFEEKNNVQKFTEYYYYY